MAKMSKAAKRGRPSTRDKGMAPKSKRVVSTKKGKPRKFHG